MSKPDFTLRTLLEAGVHLGHQSHRWNPRMDPYIHSKRNGIHIIDLTQTVVLFRRALKEIEEIVSKGGSMLFVGTKRQAQLPIEQAAKRSAQHYVNHRWLGGTLTNWKTVSNSISRLEELDERIKEGLDGLTKKERLGMLREQAKLQASHGGIRNMKYLPDILFVVDVKKESLAVAEANKLNIPVVAVVDTNCPPEGITHVIPGNDDATRSINLYCELIAKAALEGMNTQMGQVGFDMGEKGDGDGASVVSLAKEKDDHPAAKPTEEKDGNGESVASPVNEDGVGADASDALQDKGGDVDAGASDTTQTKEEGAETNSFKASQTKEKSDPEPESEVKTKVEKK